MIFGYCIDAESKYPAIPPEWWGHKYGFVSGGFLGAELKKKRSMASETVKNRAERTAFHEEDQENLYNLVQVCDLFVIQLVTCSGNIVTSVYFIYVKR